MCCCGQPTINGQPGYKWQPNDSPSVRSVNPPELLRDDTLLHDEPGRCGRGCDSHCHHFRLVEDPMGGLYLLVRHGGGDERMRLGRRRTVAGIFAHLDSDDRYWLFQAIYHGMSDAVGHAEIKVNRRWHQAAAEKRIKVRKVRGKEAFKVSIEPIREKVSGDV